MRTGSRPDGRRSAAPGTTAPSGPRGAVRDGSGRDGPNGPRVSIAARRRPNLGHNANRWDQ